MRNVVRKVEGTGIVFLMMTKMYCWKLLILLVVFVLQLASCDGFVFPTNPLLAQVKRNRYGFPKSWSVSSSPSSSSSSSTAFYSSSSSSSYSSTPQLLEFQEPKTNTTVILVGSMHYNPTSMNLAKTTIDKLGQENRLGSVLIESCDIRWEKTTEMYKQRPILKKFLNSEMRLAADTALSYDRPVVLGDQRINITSDSLKSSFMETLSDLTTPLSGWQRFVRELKQSYDETLPMGGGGGGGGGDSDDKDYKYISASDFLDPKLLLAMPVSMVKYPIAFLLRDPIATSIVLTLIAALTNVEDTFAAEQVMDGTESTWSIVGSICFSILETLFFARVFLKPMLAERNVIIAQNILRQCEIYSKEGNNSQQNNYRSIDGTTSTSKNNGFFNFLNIDKINPFGTKSSNSNDSRNDNLEEVIYTSDSPKSTNPRVVQGTTENNGEIVVVAVLGMAHCNGVMKLLKDQNIE